MYGAFKEHLQRELQGIREAGFYKEERIIATPQGAEVKVASGGALINLCANNYLGLAQDPRVKAAAHEGLDRWGYGMASVRFICGTQTIHKELEAQLSSWLQLEDTILRSPIDGIVRERMAVAGEYRAAGTPVVTVVRQDPLRLQLGVPERSASEIRSGQHVRVTDEGIPETHEGRVVRLSPSIAEGTRTLAIEASLPNPDARLRPGTFARADIVISEASALVVPQSAVIVFAGVEKVLTVENGTARERRIQTGAKTGDQVEVIDGLAEGDVVVVKAGGIADGDAVTVAAP